MSLYDAHIMVDWSGGNDTGLTPRKDAIWIGEAGQAPVYLRNRKLAEDWLQDRIARALQADERLCIGFDFPFGFPAGFGAALTGSDDPLAVWGWFEGQIEDAPKANNRFDLAGEINRRFEGIGPFWFNGLKRPIEDLPHKGTDRTDTPFPERRAVEDAARGAFTCWQMGGAGAVGSQVFMGLPVLERLRRRFADQVAVWPFEDLADVPIAFVEIWPSLLKAAVADAPDAIKDAAQVRVTSAAVQRLDEAGRLADVLASFGPEAKREGWILGVGAEAVFQAAAVPRPDRLPSNCFALPPGVDWTRVEEAQERLKEVLRPVVGQRWVSLDHVGGAILAEDVVAVRSHPPAANSAVDGYGLWLDEDSPKTLILPLLAGRSAAGAPFEGTVPVGHGVQVLTGALLPDGVNTVVLQEDADVTEAELTLHGPIKVGANTRKAGEDVLAGQMVLPQGRTLTAADLGLLAAVGVAKVSVRAPLKVAILSTGDELAAPGTVASPHQTYDANGPMLRQMVDDWGHGPAEHLRVGDDREALREMLDELAGRCDAILTSGGASAGAEDHVSALLREEGALSSWRVAVKPGRPLALGQWRDVPVFGLPGNPVAAFVCAALFARPALSVLGGGGWSDPLAVEVPAAFAKRKKDGRREYLRARLTPEGQAEVFASEGSGRISGLSWATGLVELPHEGIEIRPGDPVRFLPFSGLGLRG